MKRRNFLQSCAAIMTTKSVRGDDRLFTPASRPVPGIIDIGSMKQSFLDDFLLFETSKIRPVMTRPEAYSKNPVLVADRPWERKQGVRLSGQAVLYDEQENLFKMWYATAADPDGRFPWCYAISRDGYNWEKPELGIHEFGGNKKNNIIAVWNDPSYSSVMKDPNDPDPLRRYKAMGEYDGPRANHTGGAVVAFSPDGLHWTEHPGNPVIRHGRNLGDGPTLMGWDPKIRKYLFWPRPGHGLAPEIYGTGDHRHIRSHAYSTSDDFIHWTPARLMLTPDENERFDHQFLTLTGSLDGPFYIGLNGILETLNQSVSIYLMSSRDGFNWTWVDRKMPFLSRTEIGVYNDGRMPHSVPQAPIFHDSKVWVYYAALNRAHDGNPQRLDQESTTIALSTLPQNRWVGLVAGPYRGTLVTHPLRFSGEKLLIDLESATPHQAPRIPPRFDECDVRLAIEDRSGKPLTGFTIDRCQPLLTRGVHEVSWPGTDLRKLSDKPVRIRIEMRNAALYSIQFV